MLVYSVSEKIVRFECLENNQPISCNFWRSLCTDDISAKLLILDELLENGKADSEDDGILIPHEEIASLSLVDQQLLELPPPYPFDIRVDADGMLHQKEFIYDWGFFEHAEGKRLKAKQLGCFIHLEGGEQYILSSEQLALCNALNEFNSLPLEVRSTSGNLIRFSEIKEISKKSAAVLDAYLKNEDVVAPQEISLQLKKGTDDTIEILPEIKSIDNNQFAAKFDRFPQPQDTYALEASDGHRTRVVFTKDQQTELKKIKKNRRISGEEKDRLLEYPQEFFNPDIINLDNFSDRVIEIGIYKPRFYPFISPYKSQWLPGLLIEKSPVDRKLIRFKTKEELEEFKTAFEHSVQEDKSIIRWKEDDIPISEAKQFIEIAEEQFNNPGKPIQQKDSLKEKVLIIKENIEEVEHSEEKKYLEKFTHRYSEPPNLRDRIKILDHQKEGIAWLQSLCDECSGSLLADDMGLGKTLQILSFIEWHNQTKNISGKPYLVVAPVSLLENWELEYGKFFDPMSLNIYKAFGSYSSDFKKLENRQQRQIVLTTYETLRKNQFIFCAVDWAVVVLDEAQRIKSPGTLVTNAAKAVKADFKIPATGTPVENTLVDLWCIMDFAVPGLLGSAKEFTRTYQNPLKSQDVDVKELGDSLRQRIGIHIKRRLKNDVLHELPQKYIKRVECPMVEVQLQRYKMEINQVLQEDSEGVERRNKILKALFAMRDISDHPYLIDKQIELVGTDDLIATSSKLNACCEVIEEIKSKNEKLIVFAERKQTQRMLAKVLNERFGLQVSIVNGDMPANKGREGSSKVSRQQTIDRFQNKPGFNAIVMSPLVGGVGLNVTAANHVIHFSRHWNPAKEDQATDRVYRIGQEKDVYVYLPMAISSEFKAFDIVLDELLERKRGLAQASLFPTEQAEINPEELFKDIFCAHRETGPMKPLKIEDIDTVDPFIFEAVTAVLWRKQGFHTILTPQRNDKGADVIAFSDKEDLIIQVKHSNKAIGGSPVGEVLKSKGYYNSKYQKNFNLAIVTNQMLNNNAIELAIRNGIRIYDRSKLSKLLNSITIDLPEIMETESRREI